MITKILFLTISSFNLRDFKRFGIELLENNGFEVEVWDLTNIFFPHIEKVYRPPDPVEWPFHRVFTDRNSALQNLEDLSSEVFIVSILPYNSRYYSFFKAISRSDAKYAPFCANTYPSVKGNKKGKLRTFLYNLKKLQKDPYHRLTNFAFLRLPSSWIKLRPPNLILAGGKESIRYQPPVDRLTEILWIHALDYDLYLKEKNKSFSEKSTAVFLDEYLPFHPDFFRQKVPPPIKAGEYYPLLNKFFTRVEQQLRLKVIIAAHPRSSSEKLSNSFERREWIFGQTIKLVKESKLVLAHSSTSLNFANLYHKPVIFLTMTELDKTYKGPLIDEVANLFGKKPIYIDRDNNIDWNVELTVSKMHYKNYRRDYIKTETSEELPFWLVVAERLKKGF
jgi:hypothetical protein